MIRKSMIRRTMSAGLIRGWTAVFRPHPREACRCGARGLPWVLLAAALAGCGLGDGAGSLMVDPGKYSVLHCQDLVAQAKALQAREKDLRNLEAKASEGGGGGLIGSIAYRPEFESILTQEKLVQREAAEKHCELTPNFQSDQTIR